MTSPCDKVKVKVNVKVTVKVKVIRNRFYNVAEIGGVNVAEIGNFNVVEIGGVRKGHALRIPIEAPRGGHN